MHLKKEAFSLVRARYTKIVEQPDTGAAGVLTARELPRPAPTKIPSLSRPIAVRYFFRKRHLTRRGESDHRRARWLGCGSKHVASPSPDFLCFSLSLSLFLAFPRSRGSTSDVAAVGAAAGSTPPEASLSPPPESREPLRRRKYVYTRRKTKSDREWAREGGRQGGGITAHGTVRVCAAAAAAGGGARAPSACAYLASARLFSAPRTLAPAAALFRSRESQQRRLTLFAARSRTWTLADSTVRLRHSVLRATDTSVSVWLNILCVINFKNNVPVLTFSLRKLESIL